MTTPSTMTPACRKRCTSDTTRPSGMESDRSCTSLDWLTVSKKRSRSMDAAQTLPASASAFAARSASCAERFGLNPKLRSENLGSYIGVSCWTIACCTSLSTTVGIPSLRVFPLSSLGISTLRTGIGLYLPASSLPMSAS